MPKGLVLLIDLIGTIQICIVPTVTPLKCVVPLAEFPPIQQNPIIVFFYPISRKRLML